MNTAKDELNTTMKLIAKVLIFKRWWRKMRFLKKVDKKLTLAEQGIKSRRMNMLTIQVTTFVCKWKFQRKRHGFAGQV